MKTFKFFFMGLIILASTSFTLKGQGPVSRYSFTTDWSLDPAEFDIPCLTEKISGIICVEVYSIWTENNKTYHSIYREKIEGVLEGVGGEKYEARAFDIIGNQGFKGEELVSLKTFNFVWPIEIWHDGKLLLRTWWQWHETWNLKDLSAPVVQFNFARAVCH